MLMSVALGNLRRARQHNDANVLSLPGRFISEAVGLECVDSFLNAEFELKNSSGKDYSASISKAIKIARAQLETFALVDLPPNTPLARPFK